MADGNIPIHPFPVYVALFLNNCEKLTKHIEVKNHHKPPPLLKPTQCAPLCAAYLSKYLLVGIICHCFVCNPEQCQEPVTHVKSVRVVQCKITSELINGIASFYSYVLKGFPLP